MSTFHLQIVTPDKLFMDEEVEALTIRTTEGDLTILKDHIGFVSNLKIHVAGIKQDGKTRTAAIAGGVIQSDKGKTTVIAMAAEWSDTIDVERARRAKEESEKKLQMYKDDEKQIKITEYRLKKAINRMNAAK